MEPLNQLKRRSTDLLKQAQQSMPSLPKSININMPDVQASLPSLPRLDFGRSSSRKDKDKPAAVQGTWERIDIPALPRSSHSLNVVSGSAYIFGGETEPCQPVDNDMHIVRLPFSSAGADYHRVEAKAASAVEQDATPSSEQAKNADDAPQGEGPKGKGNDKDATADDTRPRLDRVPPPRVGHATAVIGSRIFLFGGRGGPDMKPLEEAGRVWVYDTRSHAWSHLDPEPAVRGGAIVPQPSPRSFHCATATDRPRDFPSVPPASAEPATPRTWRQWALGDTSRTGIPQDPVVGYVAEQAVDEESDGYGTFFVHAGCLAGGDRTSDLWAFDVRTRTWTELPAAPGPSRSGTAICISKSRLFRFGGYDGESELGGQLDVLPLELETFDDGHSKGEVAIHARAGWQTILQSDVDASSAEMHVEPRQAWPAPRSAAALQALTVGGGKECLVLAMGERAPGAHGRAAAAAEAFLDDVWTFEVPPLGMSPASLRAAFLQAVGKKTGEGRWQRVGMGEYDDESGQGMPAARGWLASAPMADLEETGIVVWGGLGAGDASIGDGWILRLGKGV
ncbi:Kelch-type beta propeller [Metarhizium album ARSEF 1941]|uniref:Kelch-type beta propeller n=1 Tax=Metarhizium album (strain ARSEF 1941) TaxID=1081103 RepID=A0A0B2WUI7_METAS|nr:Kelch-type beta propeller [Metarhizium album ARSEF 1941]KHN96610.1 Kelch-type beta propeller [Metarhizium album ARSEF 1941]